MAASRGEECTMRRIRQAHARQTMRRQIAPCPPEPRARHRDRRLHVKPCEAGCLTIEDFAAGATAPRLGEAAINARPAR
ncbi:trancriptional regulator, MerR family [Burkholderia pseudomallei 305]|nr:trancriptional regulator, MerR family [Burkholderia pseudomallei 305]